MLPAQYAWFEPVLIAAIVVFVVDLIGNTITFSNRFFNALATAIVFAIIFGALIHFGIGDVSMAVKTPQ
ncbi:MAG: hypothetical protein ACR2PH_17850 [Desulfobulbia bacterium]